MTRRVSEERIDRMLGRVRAYVATVPRPYVSEEAEERRNPYRTLVACLISLRTKEAVTGAASRRLFALADTPEAMLRLRQEEIAQAIKPALYYLTKAGNIRRVSQLLMDAYEGRVPDQMEELLGLPGVGRKTANLVLTMAFDKMGICVDTHVHRVTNRWGWVQTNTPDETETALRERLPERHWKTINSLLVPFGQFLCVPISPLCGKCPVREDCRRIGVPRSR